MPTCKAHLFWLTPNDATMADLLGVCRQKRAPGEVYRFHHGWADYALTDVTWHRTPEALTGTVYKLRSNNLPAAITQQAIRDLPIDESTDLGEPMVFAVYPGLHCAVVHYSHYGARHTTVVPSLQQLGFDHAIQVDPVLREDMLRQLEDMQVFRRMEFRFDNPAEDSELRGRPSVAQLLDTMESFAGFAVRVEITMGHAEGTLNPVAVKQFGRWLSRLGAVEIGEDSEVKSAKVFGADNDGDTYEELDLLKARVAFEFEAQQTHRRLNPRSCRQGLMRAFEGGYSQLVRRQLQQQR